MRVFGTSVVLLWMVLLLLALSSLSLLSSSSCPGVVVDAFAAVYHARTPKQFKKKKASGGGSSSTFRNNNNNKVVLEEEEYQETIAKLNDKTRKTIGQLNQKQLNVDIADDDDEFGIMSNNKADMDDDDEEYAEQQQQEDEDDDKEEDEHIIRIGHNDNINDNDDKEKEKQELFESILNEIIITEQKENEIMAEALAEEERSDREEKDKEEITTTTSTRRKSHFGESLETELFETNLVEDDNTNIDNNDNYNRNDIDDKQKTNNDNDNNNNDNFSLVDIVAQFPTRLPEHAMETFSCPCGSTGKLYANCCAPFHFGQLPLYSPILAARARYTAYYWKLIPFLIQSTHPSSPEYCKYDNNGNNDIRAWASQLHTQATQMFASYEYIGLEDVHEEWSSNTDDDDNNDSIVYVDFKVRLKSKQPPDYPIIVIHETSKYQQTEQGSWLYVSGDFEILTPKEKQ